MKPLLALLLVVTSLPSHASSVIYCTNAVDGEDALTIVMDEKSAHLEFCNLDWSCANRRRVDAVLKGETPYFRSYAFADGTGSIAVSTSIFTHGSGEAILGPISYECTSK